MPMWLSASVTFDTSTFDTCDTRHHGTPIPTIINMMMAPEIRRLR